LLHLLGLVHYFIAWILMAFSWGIRHGVGGVNYWGGLICGGSILHCFEDQRMLLCLSSGICNKTTVTGGMKYIEDSGALWTPLATSTTLNTRKLVSSKPLSANRCAEAAVMLLSCYRLQFGHLQFRTCIRASQFRGVVGDPR